MVLSQIIQVIQAKKKNKKKMQKIYISHWSKGEEEKPEGYRELVTTLIEAFIKTFKKKNEQEIILLTDSETVNRLTEYTIENCTVLESLDRFNSYESYQWPLVKVKVISEILEPEVLHIDYDFMIDYDINHLIDYLRTENIDALYQFWESLADGAKYYTNFLKGSTEYKEKVSKVSDKFAYNAGITYLSPSAKNKLQEIVNQHTRYEYFGDYVAFEQLVIPTELKLSNLKVQVLSNIFRNIPQTTNMYTFENPEIKYMVSKLNKSGIFISYINFFHLYGHIKTEPWVPEFLQIISI